MAIIDVNGVRAFQADKLAKHNLFETPHMFCDVYCLEPGQAQKPHAHAGATKFYYVLEGTPTLLVGSERRRMGPGGMAWSAPGEEHGVINEGAARAVLLVAMGPNPNAPRA